MSKTTFSVSRPRFLAIVISASTGTVFSIPDIEQLQTSKREDGSSGTFSFTMPLVVEYGLSRKQTPAQNAYSQVAGPMDLVALFGWRNSVGYTGIAPTELDPISSLGGGVGDNVSNADALNALTYGDPGAVSVQALGQIPTCLMIGMVDAARISKGYTGSRSSFMVNGRDLTKIFEINWTSIPNASQAGQSGAPSTDSNPGFLGLAQLQVSSATSGPIFLRNVFDLLVAKDLTAGSNASGTTFTEQVIQQYKAYGYPWRNFIRVDQMDDSYHPLNAGNYPVYSPQAGAVWPTIMELRNAPISRLFVNEIGELIYDDSYEAWVNQASQGEITSDLIRDFDSGFDDGSLATLVSVVPGKLLLSNKDVQAVLGNFFPGTGFVNGIAQAKTAGEAHVATLGYRYSQFSSQFDLSFTDAARRQKYIILNDNSVFTANLVVKGDARYKVGQRWLVDETSGRPETSNKTWYVDGVSQSCQFGNDWTTTLSLRFPMPQP